MFTRGSGVVGRQACSGSRQAAQPSALVDARVIYCGDCLDQLRELSDGCVDLIYIDRPFNSNRNYEVFWGEARESERSRGGGGLPT